MYKSPPFEIADRLSDEIMAFLIDCGDTYQGKCPEVIDNILFSIATGQFIYKKGCYFVSWWKVEPLDVEAVAKRQPVITKIYGTAMVISECGVKGDYMRQIVKKLRYKGKGMKSVMWHRPAKQDKFYLFPRQKGASYG